jgi:hypothetical protein
MVRRSHGGILCYEVTTLCLRRANCGRINAGNSGDLYMKSGKNCFEPTGQTQLVVPTEAVIAWSTEYSRGEMGSTIYSEVLRRLSEGTVRGHDGLAADAQEETGWGT